MLKVKQNASVEDMLEVLGSWLESKSSNSFMVTRSSDGHPTPNKYKWEVFAAYWIDRVKYEKYGGHESLRVALQEVIRGLNQHFPMYA